MKDVREIIHQGISNNLQVLKTHSVLVSQNEKLWEVMNSLFLATQKIIVATDKDDLSEIDFTKLMILTNCLADLIAVSHLIQIGWFRPAGTVLRGILENTSLAVAIHQRPEIYEKYQKGDFDIPKAVTIAKNFISEIGQVNGMLSNTFTHEPHDTIGRSLRMDGDSTEIMLVPGVDQHNGQMFALVSNITAMCSLMVGEAVEWCLAIHLEEFTFWEKVDSNTLKAKPNDLKTKAKLMAKDLEVLLSKK